MSAPLDERAKDEIIGLAKQGMKPADIARSVGRPGSTVRSVISRYKAEHGDLCDATTDSVSQVAPAESPAPAREEVSKVGQTDAATRYDGATSKITQDFAAYSLVGYLEVTKTRAIEAHENRARIIEDRGKDESAKDPGAWEEVQFLKLFKDGVKMLVECSGLSAEAVGAPAANPVDAYLENALKQLKEAGI